MNNSALVMSLSILGSSLVGSWHCAGMCGPVASFVAYKGGLRSYHLGRGIGYTSLGLFAGWLGSFFLKSDFYWMRITSGVLFATTILVMGIHLFMGGKSISFFKPTFVNRWTSKKTSGFFLGMLSMFLPCGWLYSYVLAAAASQSAYSGALLMFLFWIGTLPALSAFPVFVSKTIAVSNEKKKKLAGIILILASLYSLLSFYYFHTL